MTQSARSAASFTVSVIGVAVFLASSVLTACSGAAAPTTSAPPSTVPSVAPSTVPSAATSAAATPSSAASPAAASTTGTTLVVYSAQGYDKDMVDAFQKATGITTTLYDDHTGIVLSKIEAERSNPQWGLVWIDGDQALATLDGEGQLVKGYEPKVDWTTQGQSFVPKDQSYVPTGFTLAGTLFYNATNTPTPPTTWQSLLQPEFKGKVGILNPVVDGPAYPVFAGLMQDLGGVDAGEKYVSQLKDNGAQIFSDPHVELTALQNGQISVMIAQSVYGIGAGLKSTNIKAVYPSHVTPVPSVIGIDAKAPAAEQAAAKKFIEFVLSPAGQDIMKKGDSTGDSLYWPVVAGVDPLPGLPTVSSLPVQPIDPYVWGPREAEVNKWFSANILQS